jgi:hypothetical protein
LKRLTGRHSGVDTGGRALPDESKTVALRAAERVPDLPANIGKRGADLWRRAWAEAIVWLSPDSDRATVERACRLADAEELARQQYFDSMDPRDGTMYVKLSHELGIVLAEMGFTPIARTRMGVAEVKRVSKIEELRRRRSEDPVVIDADLAE